MFHRIKQFYWDISSHLNKLDEEFLILYLNPKELESFNKLKAAEKYHCIRVAKTALDFIETNNYKHIDIKWFVRIGLLHDIGKIGGNLTVVDRSLLVLLNKFTKGKIKRFTNIKKVDIYYNHPQKGVEILKAIGNYDEKFLYLVRNHHNYNITKDELLNILIYCDSIN